MGIFSRMRPTKSELKSTLCSDHGTRRRSMRSMAPTWFDDNGSPDLAPKGATEDPEFSRREGAQTRWIQSLIPKRCFGTRDSELQRASQG